MPVVTNTQAIIDQANAERVTEVSTEVAKKFKVIGKRTSEITTAVDALTAFSKAHDTKVAAFKAAVEAAQTPEQVEAALELYQFPERDYAFAPLPTLYPTRKSNS